MTTITWDWMWTKSICIVIRFVDDEVNDQIESVNTLDGVNSRHSIRIEACRASQQA